jgi:hypothetical protein
MLDSFCGFLLVFVSAVLHSLPLPCSLLSHTSAHGNEGCKGQQDRGRSKKQKTTPIKWIEAGLASVLCLELFVCLTLLSRTAVVPMYPAVTRRVHGNEGCAGQQIGRTKTKKAQDTINTFNTVSLTLTPLF